MNQTKDLADDGSGELNRDEIIGNICKRTIISQVILFNIVKYDFLFLCLYINITMLIYTLKSCLMTY